MNYVQSKVPLQFFECVDYHHESKMGAKGYLVPWCINNILLFILLRKSHGNT